VVIDRQTRFLKIQQKQLGAQIDYQGKLRPISLERDKRFANKRATRTTAAIYCRLPHISA